jgi:branched-chain amino acid transport system permease protein
MLKTARAEPLWPRPPLWVSALGTAALALLIAYPFIFTTSFSQHLMILILLYALMAQSWNVVAGLSGQISLGQAIFFGIGAYSSTVLFAKYGVTPWVGLMVGMLLSALAAVAIGVPTLRLRGHYFAIATLLIGSSVQIVFQRWDWVGAASGLYVPIERCDGTGWAQRPGCTCLALVLSAIPHEQSALLLPRPGCGGDRLFGGVEAASQSAGLPPAGIAG